MDHTTQEIRPGLLIINKKKRTCQIVITIPVDHTEKLKKSKKKKVGGDEYPDLAREQKNLWNTKVTIIPVIVLEHYQRTWKKD